MGLLAWAIRVALGVASLSACVASQTGATQADIVRASDRAARGARVFSDDCSGCHGRRGEGLTQAPAILGPSALPEYARTPAVAQGFAFQDPQELEIQQQTHLTGPAMRRPFRTTQDLYDFIASHELKTRASVLPPEDRWAVVSFMMVVQGVSVPDDGVNPANAASIPVRP